MRKALIVDGRVNEVLEADSFPDFHPDLQWVECGTDVVAGYLYAGGTFSEPTEPETPPRTQCSRRDFLKLFTPEEQLAVVTATMSNAQVKLLWDNLLAADYIDLADPEVEEGIDYLIAQELIDADRKAEVLA